MAADNESKIGHESEGGMSAEHPMTALKELHVAPSTSKKDTHTTARSEFQIVACWKAEDICFDFDEAFVRKEAEIQFKALRDLYEKLVKRFKRISYYQDSPRPPIAIFGHADPVGECPYNKTLSERRAKAVYGVLKRDVEVWAEVFAKKKHAKYLQDRLNGLGYNPGTVDGNVQKAETKSAIRKYIKDLCPDFVLQPSDFLGGGKQTFQGCSEFNPILIFSETEAKKFKKNPDKTDRNKENQPNRRVVAFLFEPKTKFDSGLWPCPTEPDIQGCKDRFYTNWQKRLSFQAKRKEYDRGDETFACRFYDRLAGMSPCEAVHLFLPPIRLVFEWTTWEFNMPFSKFKKQIKYYSKGIAYYYTRNMIEWTDESGHTHWLVEDAFSQHAELEQIERRRGGRTFGEGKFTTHVVKTHLLITKKDGQTWYIVTAVVVDAKTKQKLFQGKIGAANLYDIGGTWVKTGGAGGRKVWRKLSAVKGEKWYDPKTGKLTPSEKLERKEVKSRPNIESKIRDLHKQLCEGYRHRNINRRLEIQTLQTSARP